jgi:hypothetical protein
MEPYFDLGTYRRGTSTASTSAQMWFDRVDAQSRAEWVSRPPNRGLDSMSDRSHNP